MAEEEKVLNSESQQDVIQDGVDDIDAFIEYKNNSVSRELYDKKCEEVTKLKKALVSGEQVEQLVKEEKIDLDKLMKETYTKNLTNLDYIKNTLKIREEMIKQGKRDPALPVGDQVTATDEHTQRMNRVAEGLQQLVDYADGNPTVFLDAYQRTVIDPVIPKKRK